jgi:hypothetical protein
MFFTFPEDARWNADAQAVEFGAGIGEYEGIVRVPRQVFRRFVDGAVTPRTLPRSLPPASDAAGIGG